ncbi:hypothetical protein ACP4OV_000753 [Aristida adscensionis]
MKTRRVLEILLVSAEDLKHAHHHPRRLIKKTLRDHPMRASNCDQQNHTRGKKIWWNEKFRFLLSDVECKELTKVTLTTMERDKFYEDTSVGETRVYVDEIIREGSKLEFLQIKPAPYNIVLEDGTYKGMLKLGIKFISNYVRKIGAAQKPHTMFDPHKAAWHHFLWIFSKIYVTEHPVEEVTLLLHSLD